MQYARSAAPGDAEIGRKKKSALTSLAGATTIESGGVISPATLTFTGGLTLNDGAIFNFELGTTSDKIFVSGGTLTGATTPGALTLASAIPEPSTYALLGGLASLGLALWRRRRQARN